MPYGWSTSIRLFIVAHPQQAGYLSCWAACNFPATQALLGHVWVTTTQRYTHLEVEDLQMQVAKLPANQHMDIG